MKDLEHVYAIKDRDGKFFSDWGHWEALGVTTRVWPKLGQLSAFLTSSVTRNYDPTDEKVDLGMLGVVIDRGGRVVKLKYMEDGEIPLTELKCFKNFEDNIVNKKLDDI